MHRFALVCIILATFFTALAHGDSGSVPLTPEERLWLEENQSRIVLAVETGYAPFVFLDPQGKATGLASDYIHLIESKIGVTFRQKQFTSLNDIFEKVRTGEVNIVNAVTKTPERSQFLTFTDAFISIPNVILVDKSRSHQLSEEDLAGLKVSLVRSYAVTEYLGQKVAGLVPDLVADDLNALLNVSFGRSDAAVIDLATASYLISQKGITNLQVIGEITFKVRLAIGTPINEPVLHEILQKALASITDAERQEINKRWINASSQSIYSDWRVRVAVGSGLLVVLISIAVVFIWNRMLRRQVKVRTAELETERANLEQRVQQRTSELARSETRYRLLASATFEGIAMTEHGCFIDANDQFLNMLGYKRDELVGLCVESLIPVEDRQRVMENIRLDRESHSEHAMMRKDGARIQVEAHGQTFEQDGRTLRMTALCDITERKRADEAIKHIQQLLDETEQIGKMGGWALQINTEKLTWSKGIYAIHEVDGAFEPTVEKAIDFYAPTSRPFIELAVRRAMEQGEAFDTELEIITAKGKPRFVHAIGKADLANQRVSGFFQDITERKQHEAIQDKTKQQLELQLAEISKLQLRLQEQVIRDPLTGLHNRRFLDETLPRELARAKREGYSLALIMIDLDKFKRVNDTYGHAAGDEVLKALSAILEKSARGSDVICRYGGEEFLVALPRMLPDLALQRANEWRRELSGTPIRHGDFMINMTLSAGVAAFPDHGIDIDTLLSHADQALYRSKNEGRNRVTCFEALA